MTSVLTIHLLRQSLSAAVQHNVHLNGAPTGRPGVAAIVARDGQLGWCVLADHPDNPGVSATNGAESYAQAVCAVLSCDVGDLAWFEVDSDGHVDELHLLGANVGFAPLVEDGTEPRTMAAFVARAAKLPGGMPQDAARLLEQCFERFEG